MKTLTRILYSSFADISLPYGPGVNERGFIKDMAKRFGENFKVVIPRPSKGLPKELQNANISYMNYLKSSRSILGWVEARLLGCFRLRSDIKEFKPDLMVIRSGSLALPYLFSAIDGSVPFALKTAGAGSFEAFYRTNPLRRITSGSNEYILSKLLAKSIAVDVTGDVHRESLIKLCPKIADRVYVIDNGVDLGMFSSRNGPMIREKYGIAADDIVIGYVGGFPMRRGGKEVIDLIGNLYESLPVKGIIVGDSGEVEQCREHARHTEVSDLITITGQVDYEKVPDLMDAMDIGLGILRPQQQHACEQKVRQYIASGLCVIGTQGSNDFLRGHDFARVVPGENMSEITDAALSLLEEGSIGLKKRAEKARQYAKEKLSIESRNNSRLTIWDEALSSKSKPKELDYET